MNARRATGDRPRTPSFDRFRAVPALVARAPWWVLLLVGVACIALGGALVLRPLSSLAVLAIYIGLSFIASGIGDLLNASSAGSPRLASLLGSAWITLGLMVLLWRGIALDVLPTLLAVVLLTTGVFGLFAVLRGTRDQRAAAVLFALADMVFGVLALAWPDVTLLIVAVLFGARTMFFGFASAWAAVISKRTTDVAASPIAKNPSQWVRLIGAVGAIVLAVMASGLAIKLQPGTAQADAFYSAPDKLPDAPGTLLRVEPFHTAVPAGAVAWRILYTTTIDDEEPTIASGIVLTRDDDLAEPRDAIAWAHGTTGYATNCAPSLLHDPFGAGAVPALDQIIDQGWALVATDYAGLGTAGAQPYLIGQGAARSVLDAVRAAQQMDEISLSGQTTLWGHSQGGHASLWAGELAASYAPELDVVGVVSLAPASDAIGLVRHLPNVTGGSVFASFVAEAYFAHYPDVTRSRYIEPSARTVVREMSTRCLSEPGALVSVLAALSIDTDMSIFRTDPTTGPLGDRLRENTPRGEIVAPLFVGQGGSDPLVDPAMQRAYVSDRCADGQALEYREYAGFDHMGVVGSASPLIPELFNWTKARFSGEPFDSNCDSFAGE